MNIDIFDSSNKCMNTALTVQVATAHGYEGETILKHKLLYNNHANVFKHKALIIFL